MKIGSVCIQYCYTTSEINLQSNTSLSGSAVELADLTWMLTHEDKPSHKEAGSSSTQLHPQTNHMTAYLCTVLWPTQIKDNMVGFLRKGQIQLSMQDCQSKYNCFSLPIQSLLPARPVRG